MDAIILRYATSSADCFNGCEYYAEKMCRVIQAKADLGELWAFLDRVLSSVTEEDRRVLKIYSESRRKEKSAAVSGGGQEESAAKRALHRSLMKFSRRLRGRLASFARQIGVLREYFCLVYAPNEQGG